MKGKNEVCLIIQARTSSERCPNKMLKPFADTNLLDIALEKITQIKSLDCKTNFFLSAYEPELKDVAHKYDLNVFHRSEKSARSEGTPMTDMYEWWDKLGFKYGVLVNACAPFLSTQTIDDFIDAYLETPSDGLFGVIEKKNYFWNRECELITPWPQDQACMNTKAVEKTYEAAHCLYAGRLDQIEEGIWMGDFQVPGQIELFPMSEEEVFDIDYEWQFKTAEALWKGTRESG